MKILITSSGNLAARLFAALKDEHEVRVLRRQADPAYGRACQVGDVSRLDDVTAAMEGCDVVFHTAVRNNDTMPFEAYPQFLQSNVDGSFNVFYAAARLKTPRIVYSSTSMVLGFQRYTGASSPTGRAVRIHDTMALDGTCIYSFTKALAERTADFFRDEHGVNVIGLRYGWMAPLKLYADPQMVMRTLQYCFHPDDGVAANLLAAASSCTGNYLICGAPSFDDADAEALWQDPRSVLAARYPRELAYIDRLGWPIKPIGCWLDCSAAMHDLGYRPRYGFGWYVAQHEAGAFGSPEDRPRT
jgi:nucleoside-diphosphate-sugar epimerase